MFTEDDKIIVKNRTTGDITTIRPETEQDLSDLLAGQSDMFEIYVASASQVANAILTKELL
jgi:hypothetical protein